MSADKNGRERVGSVDSDASLETKCTETVGEEQYVVLCETSGREFESWYYFIRYSGNEKPLAYLQKQLEKIDMYILDDFSTFDLDLDHFFSNSTAKEMTKLEINSYMFHRKFDGKMQMISLGLKKRDDNDDMLEKLFDKLGLGQLEEYVEDEDLDSDDFETDSGDDSSDDSSDDDQELVPLPEETTKPSKLVPSAVEKVAGGRHSNKRRPKK